MPRRRVTLRADARGLALEILVRVETTDAFADVLLGDRLAGASLAGVDRALATQLVYGTLAWQGRLDHHLAGLVRMPLARLDPPVRAALRLGLYQLLFLDRVPAYAAVDASVGLARTAGRGAAGLVNAVLRQAAARGRAGLPLPERDADPIGRLAVEWSHPRWLVARWAAEIGAEELPALLAANNVRGPTTIRANRRRTTRETLRAELVEAGIEASLGRWAPEALTVRRGAERLRGLAAWRDGRFTFQGEASQLIAPLLAPPPGARVLDACAAPGGKTGHAAELLDRGLVVGLDRRATGVGRLAVEAKRLGAVAVHAMVGDARQPPLGARFDAVLVDAPCTGLGTLRRHPEVRWRRRPEDVARLAALQRAILTELAPLVRPGGVLVYAVCTLTQEETSGVVAEFCARAPRFAPEPVVEVPAEIRTADGFLRTLPHRHDLDGFFAARLRARD